MNEDKTYNGWSNYETWNAKLWMDNDEGSNSYWNERALACLEDHINEGNGVENDRETAIHELADEIKKFHQENIPEVVGAYADLLQAAVDSINYYEIAENMIGDIDVFCAMWNQPGCLPEMEPTYFLDEDEAEQYLIDELEGQDEGDNDELTESIDECIEQIKSSGGCYFEGYNYTVSKV